VLWLCSGCAVPLLCCAVPWLCSGAPWVVQSGVPYVSCGAPWVWRAAGRRVVLRAGPSACGGRAGGPWAPPTASRTCSRGHSFQMHQVGSSAQCEPTATVRGSGRECRAVHGQCKTMQGKPVQGGSGQCKAREMQVAAWVSCLRVQEGKKRVLLLGFSPPRVAVALTVTPRASVFK